MDLAAELADEICNRIDDDRIGTTDEGYYAYEMRSKLTSADNVIAVDLVRLDDGTVARTAKITVELL